MNHSDCQWFKEYSLYCAYEKFIFFMKKNRIGLYEKK